MLENGKFKNKQLAFVVLLKDSNNVVSEAEFHCIINMNYDYKICKQSQPKLFQVGEFNVARIQCKKKELILKKEQEKNENEDEIIDDDKNMSSSGDFGNKSYGIETDEELINNENNEHE